MGAEQKPSQPRSEHLVFVGHWLHDHPHLPSIPVLLFQKGTSLKDGSAVLFTGDHPLTRSHSLPLPQFMQAVVEFRDTRRLGDNFPQQGGFENEPNRQLLVDVLKKPLLFAFDVMLRENGLRIEGDVVSESDTGGLLSRITGIPVERAYVLVPQVPTKLRLEQLNLLYAAH